MRRAHGVQWQRARLLGRTACCGLYLPAMLPDAVCPSYYFAPTNYINMLRAESMQVSDSSQPLQGLSGQAST